MKKIIIIVILILASTFLLSNKKKDTTSQQVNKEKVDVQSNIDNQDDKYSIAWYKLEENEKVSLHNNLVVRMQSTNALEENNCKALINAGFYHEDFTPIGLFVLNGETVSAFQTNRLFNSFVALKNGTFEIHNTIPEGYQSVVQTGPLFVDNSQIVSLDLQTDKPARRMILMKNQDTYIISIYGYNNAYTGPYLSEVGEVLVGFAERNNIKDYSAVNLDGGSASAFLTEHFTLTEITTIGSYFCIED